MKMFRFFREPGSCHGLESVFFGFGKDGAPGANRTRDLFFRRDRITFFDELCYFAFFVCFELEKCFFDGIVTV